MNQKTALPYSLLRPEPSAKLEALASDIENILFYSALLSEAILCELDTLRNDIAAILEDRLAHAERERGARTVNALTRTGGMLVEGFDSTKPNVARIYDAFLNGKTNFQADRTAADAIMRLSPVAATAARDNRQFLKRAVTYTARRGIRQFIDIGSGLPTMDNTHEIARREDWTARVVYVDNDPVAVLHGTAILGAAPQAVVITGDLREPQKVIENPALQATLDLSQPAVIILAAVLHFLSDTEARAAVDYLKGSVAPGSALVISHATADDAAPEETSKVQGVYEAAQSPIYLRTREEVTRFFDGFTLVPPGVVDVNHWHTEPGAGRTQVIGYGGVAVKP